MSAPDHTRSAIDPPTTDPSATGLPPLTDPSATAPATDALADDRPSLDFPDPATAADGAAATLAAAVDEARSRLVAAGRALAFWLATVLPLTYLPALATGAAGERPLALLCVLSAHAAALVLGRGYAADGDAEADLVAADDAR